MSVTAPATDGAPASGYRPRMHVSRFALFLGLIVLAGLALRVAFVLAARGSDFELRGDDFYYHWQATALADGHWFIEPLVWRALGRFDPTAGHPPTYTLYLGFWSWVGLGTAVWHRLASCLLGAAMVALCGLTGRRIAASIGRRREAPPPPAAVGKAAAAGNRAGLLAAAAAAAYPSLWISDGMLVSESMYQLLIAAVLLTAYRLWQQPTVGNAALLGGAIALSSLTRPEAVLLFPFIGIPFLLKGSVETRQRVKMCLVGGLVGLALVAPWLIRNMTIFEKPVTFASGAGTVAQGANCDSTYSGSLLGYWDPRCIIAARPPKTAEEKRLLEEKNGVPGFSYLVADPDKDESVLDEEARRKSWEYVKDHLDRAPLVALARLGRVYEVFRPAQNIQLDDFFERRGLWTSRFGLAGYYILVLLSIAGLYAMRSRQRRLRRPLPEEAELRDADQWRRQRRLRRPLPEEAELRDADQWRRRVPISPFVALVAMVTLTTAVSIGLTRYRSGLDVGLVVVGGVGADALWRWWSQRRGEHAGDVAPEPAPEPAT